MIADTLPAAADSERQLVAALLVDPSQIAKVRHMLPVSAMGHPLHRTTLGVVCDMDRRGEAIDVLTVKARLEGRPEFAGESPTAYLAELGAEFIVNAKVADHASRIAEADLKRRLHCAAAGLAADALNGRAGDELLADLGAMFEDFRRGQSPGERFKLISAKELAEGDYRVNWVVDYLLVDGQPCILAGGKKTLKTTLLCALLLAIATGTPFLGKFNVGRARRVVLFSGESGEATLQETCRRIAWSMGWDLADVPNFALVTDVPQLNNDADLAAIEAVIDGADVVALDPAYLMMPGGDAGNLFIQGAMLLKLSRLCHRLGVTLIICHHTRKHRSAELTTFDAPELEDIAWAGFQEFARQWLLVGRRERYEPGSGEHALWFAVGGSAGHGGLWALDVSEGAINDHDGRRFDVTLSNASEAREQAEQRRDDAKAQRTAEQVDGDVRAIVNALAAMPGMGGTKTDLKDATGLYQSRFSAAVASALLAKYILPTRITKGNKQTYNGYELNPATDHPDTPG